MPNLVSGDYFEESYPSSRRLTFDMGRVGMSRHHMKALLEVNVTAAWELVQQSRQTGQKISFFAWLVKATADCIALHPQVTGINQPARNKVIVFKDVDVSIMVEKEVNGILVPLPYVVRRANQKTLAEIQDEIQACKTQKVENESGYVLGESGAPAWMKLFVSLPQWLRLPLFRIFLKDPQRARGNMGTAMITTVGMVGHTHGWIVPYSIHPVCLALGSLNQQPVVRRGEVEIAQVLHLTALIDHDVVDGAPAARFIDDLVKKLEAGWGL